MVRCGLPPQPELLGSAQLQQVLHSHGLAEQWPALRETYYFAKEAHLGQTRDDGTPYIHHCARVLRNAVAEFGVKDLDALRGALLHDTLEDTKVSEKEIEKRFGSRTLDFARRLTKPERGPGESYQQRNERYLKGLEEFGSTDLLALKLADRLDNVEDTHLMPDRNKIRRYVQDTNDHYLPLAERHFPPVAEKMAAHLTKLSNWMAGW